MNDYKFFAEIKKAIKIVPKIPSVGKKLPYIKEQVKGKIVDKLIFGIMQKN